MKIEKNGKTWTEDEMKEKKDDTRIDKLQKIQRSYINIIKSSLHNRITG